MSTSFSLQVSWLRLRDPIPQLMSLNNMTNTLNTRFRALVTDWREFVLMVRDVRSEDAGQYECQVRTKNIYPYSLQEGTATPPPPTSPKLIRLSPPGLSAVIQTDR